MIGANNPGVCEVLDKPKILFKAEINRRRYFRRFMWNLLAAVAAFGAWGALVEANQREIVDAALLRVGQIVALVVVALLLLRMVLNLLRWLRIRSERVIIFDRGFVWERGKKQAKYNWTHLKAFRQGARVLTLAGRPILARGAHTLTMRDGKVYKFTARHGDPRRFTRLVSPIIADVTGTRMGQALRGSKSVRLHRQLVITPKGVQAGKHNIPWTEVDVRVKNGRLSIYRQADNGKFRVVKRFPASQVDNLDGLLDLAHSLMQTHQPARFNIKTQI